MREGIRRDQQAAHAGLRPELQEHQKGPDTAFAEDLRLRPDAALLEPPAVPPRAEQAHSRTRMREDLAAETEREQQGEREPEDRRHARKATEEREEMRRSANGEQCPRGPDPV